MSPGSGTSLGPYQIDAPLGTGGMGQVYQATDTKLNRQVALKILPHAPHADEGGDVVVGDAITDGQGHGLLGMFAKTTAGVYRGSPSMTHG